MHEKDIELAKLLLSKLAELASRKALVDEELARVEGELESVRQLKEERSQYLDILSRAAELLNRQDLKEELPETSALEEHAEKLLGELDEIRQTASQYEELVDGLRERAPHLIASASEEPAAAVEEVIALAEVEEQALAVAEPESADSRAAVADAVADKTPDDEEAPLLEPATAADIAAADEHAGANEPEDEEREVGADTVQDATIVEAPSADDGADPALPDTEPLAVAADLEDDAADEPATGSGETDISLRRFNVSNLMRREAFTHGRGAAYIVDATSVLERVPSYDHYVRGIEPDQAREELIRDFDVLTRELSGTFHLIFDAWFQYAATHGNTLTVEFGTGPGEGTKEASDRRLRELVFEMTAKLRPVCIVTGDSTLADSVRGQGIHIIPLGEFFRA